MYILEQQISDIWSLVSSLPTCPTPSASRVCRKYNTSLMMIKDVLYFLQTLLALVCSYLFTYDDTDELLALKHSTPMSRLHMPNISGTKSRSIEYYP